MTPSTKCCSLIFDLGPLTSKIYSQNLHKIAYKSACMADRPEMFGPTAYQGVFGDGRFNGTMQNVVMPILVAMATEFGLGAEIQSPTGLSINHSVRRRLHGGDGDDRPPPMAQKLWGRWVTGEGRVGWEGRDREKARGWRAGRDRGRVREGGKSRPHGHF